ncbi:hypothetical protein BGHDH14_bghG005311000001001 [Blumeria hordei DH14]|uniref:Uncharacterized protein n=1 Tax=Blumeria graminis f. sp. hordei (strain DH14) TaxID=546991 RepID=N1JEF9_BLUG1|nr:hypothetical protein BGHDH14_bghG005311000001001 [Blumeria hordei DH14]
MSTSNKSVRSPSVSSTASSNFSSSEMPMGFLELTTPHHHRSDSTASSDSCDGFLQLTPTVSTAPNLWVAAQKGTKEAQSLGLTNSADN